MHIMPPAFLGSNRVKRTRISARTPVGVEPVAADTLLPGPLPELEKRSSFAPRPAPEVR
ncbi:hypothetical protein [Sulfuritalea sp.]|uniref:hypothetical protein n=1 Tax=Sulfuritalea sp. TaxID=2480090 RepID=UPI0025DCF44B|nr:hypothetical protein [Sulfuritalea sp.]